VLPSYLPIWSSGFSGVTGTSEGDSYSTGQAKETEDQTEKGIRDGSRVESQKPHMKPFFAQEVQEVKFKKKKKKPLESL